MHRAKLVLAFLSATIVLAAMVATASAQRFETSNPSIRATFASIRFGTTEGIEGICPLTLEGSFHSRTIVKTSELLVGYISRAVLNRAACRFTSIESLEILQSSLPWHVRYESFSGSLPNITRINLRLLSISFTLTAFGVRCLYRSTVANPARGVAERSIATGQITSFTSNNTSQIPRFEGSFICGPEGTFEGSAQVRVLATSTTLIFIRLI